MLSVIACGWIRCLELFLVYRASLVLLILRFRLTRLLFANLAMMRSMSLAFATGLVFWSASFL